MRLGIFSNVRFQQLSRVAHRGQQQHSRHNFQELQRRIYRPYLRDRNRTCHTPPHSLFTIPMATKCRNCSCGALRRRSSYWAHHGICLNTPARTNAASTNASNTAHASIENPRCFTGSNACPCSLILFLLLWPIGQTNVMQTTLVNFSFVRPHAIHSLCWTETLPDLLRLPTQQSKELRPDPPTEWKVPAIALRSSRRRYSSNELAALPAWLAKPPRKASPATIRFLPDGPQLRRSAFQACKSQLWFPE